MYDLHVRMSDGKCRAVQKGKPLTGWLKDGMSVYQAMLKKEKAHDPAC